MSGATTDPGATAAVEPRDPRLEATATGAPASSPAAVTIATTTEAAPRVWCARRDLVDDLAAAEPGVRAKAAAAIATARPKTARDRACVDVLTARTAKPARAAELYARAEAALSEIAPALRTAQARALVDAGAVDAAMALVDDLKAGSAGPLDPVVLGRMKRVEVDVLLARGLVDDAAKLVDELTKDGGADAPAMIDRIARARESAGDAGAAQAKRRDLLLRFAASEEAQAVEPLVDDGRIRFTRVEQATRIDALLRVGRAGRAAQEARTYTGTGTSSLDEAAALHVATVTALVRAGAVDEGVARAAAGATTTTPFAARDDVRRVHAWALGKAGRAAASAAAWQALSSSTADKAVAAEACFFAAFASYEADDRQRADAAFAACAPALSGTAWAAQAEWYRALIAILDGDTARAEARLAVLVQGAAKDRDAARHRYWLARMQEARGDTTTARATYAALAAEQPLDWYGLLSRARLGGPAPKGAPVVADALRRSVPNDDDARRVLLLHGLGFDDVAKGAVRARAGALPDIALAAAIGDYAWGYRRGAAFLPAQTVKGGAVKSSGAWRASFASPWRADVDAAATTAGLSSAFIYGIMRTESGFDPRAKSVVGARGLMQIMPAVARRIGGDPERLYEPKTAIAMGATLLGTHKRELGSDLLAAAAYNGAPENVAAWMQAFGALPPELFVERIPFKETRDYVKRVLSIAAVYRALDGDVLAVELPATIGPPPATVTSFPPWG